MKNLTKLLFTFAMVFGLAITVSAQKQDDKKPKRDKERPKIVVPRRDRDKPKPPRDDDRRNKDRKPPMMFSKFIQTKTSSDLS